MTPLLYLAFLAVDFNSQVKPVLEARCMSCHDRAFMLRHKDTHMTRISLPPTDKRAMPPAGGPLSAAERKVISDWVAEGVPWPQPPGTPLADDLALTRLLRAQIVKASKERSAADMKAYTDNIPGAGVGVAMLPIPAGSFTMGSPESEKSRSADEGPQHTRKIDAFWMSKYEVTWNEYRLFMFSKFSGEVPGAVPTLDAVSRPTRPYVEMSFGMGIEGYPAISMTHHAANKFAQWLSARTGHFYRLPTEAEWEYACRAGSTTPYSFGPDASNIKDFAIYDANSGGKYEKPGTKKPNAWGLFDMHGNVMEWTLDQYAADSYKSPQPWVKSKTPYPHVARGGSWNDPADRLRCAARVGSDASWKQQDPNLPKSIWYHTDALWLGIRLVRPLQIPSAEEMHALWNNGVSEDN
jgi:formylglycine-generating enzyme required for sulfatase activity